jgi:hypothetical protein
MGLYCHSLQVVSATNFLLLDRARWDFIVTPSKWLVQQISFCWTELNGTRVLYCHSLQAVSATNFLLLDRARWDFIVIPSKRLVWQISFCWTELDGTRVNKQSSMYQLAVLSTGWAVFFHLMSDGVHHSQFFSLLITFSWLYFPWIRPHT